MDLKIGDTVKCKDLDDMIRTMYELAETGIRTDWDCEKHNKRFDEYPADEACPLTVWRVAQEHEFDYQFCAYAERRTDG